MSTTIRGKASPQQRGSSAAGSGRDSSTGAVPHLPPPGAPLLPSRVDPDEALRRFNPFVFTVDTDTRDTTDLRGLVAALGRDGVVAGNLFVIERVELCQWFVQLTDPALAPAVAEMRGVLHYLTQSPDTLPPFWMGQPGAAVAAANAATAAGAKKEDKEAAVLIAAAAAVDAGALLALAVKARLMALAAEREMRRLRELDERQEALAAAVERLMEDGMSRADAEREAAREEEAARAEEEERAGALGDDGDEAAAATRRTPAFVLLRGFPYTSEHVAALAKAGVALHAAFAVNSLARFGKRDEPVVPAVVAETMARGGRLGAAGRPGAGAQTTAKPGGAGATTLKAKNARDQQPPPTPVVAAPTLSAATVVRRDAARLPQLQDHPLRHVHTWFYSVPSIEGVRVVDEVTGARERILQESEIEVAEKFVTEVVAVEAGLQRYRQWIASTRVATDPVNAAALVAVGGCGPTTSAMQPALGGAASGKSYLNAAATTAHCFRPSLIEPLRQRIVPKVVDIAAEFARQRQEEVRQQLAELQRQLEAQQAAAAAPQKGGKGGSGAAALTAAAGARGKGAGAKGRGDASNAADGAVAEVVAAATPVPALGTTMYAVPHDAATMGTILNELSPKASARPDVILHSAIAQAVASGGATAELVDERAHQLEGGARPRTPSIAGSRAASTTPQMLQPGVSQLGNGVAMPPVNLAGVTGATSTIAAGDAASQLSARSHAPTSVGGSAPLTLPQAAQYVPVEARAGKELADIGDFCDFALAGLVGTDGHVMDTIRRRRLHLPLEVASPAASPAAASAGAASPRNGGNAFELLPAGNPLAARTGPATAKLPSGESVAQAVAPLRPTGLPSLLQAFAVSSLDDAHADAPTADGTTTELRKLSDAFNALTTTLTQRLSFSTEDATGTIRRRALARYYAPSEVAARLEELLMSDQSPLPQRVVATLGPDAAGGAIAVIHRGVAAADAALSMAERKRFYATAASFRGAMAFPEWLARARYVDSEHRFFHPPPPEDDEAEAEAESEPESDEEEEEYVDEDGNVAVRKLPKRRVKAPPLHVTYERNQTMELRRRAALELARGQLQGDASAQREDLLASGAAASGVYAEESVLLTRDADVWLHTAVRLGASATVESSVHAGAVVAGVRATLPAVSTAASARRSSLPQAAANADDETMSQVAVAAPTAAGGPHRKSTSGLMASTSITVARVDPPTPRQVRFGGGASPSGPQAAPVAVADQAPAMRDADAAAAPSLGPGDVTAGGAMLQRLPAYSALVSNAALAAHTAAATGVVRGVVTFADAVTATCVVEPVSGYVALQSAAGATGGAATPRDMVSSAASDGSPQADALAHADSSAAFTPNNQRVPGAVWDRVTLALNERSDCVTLDAAAGWAHIARPTTRRLVTYESWSAETRAPVSATAFEVQRSVSVTGAVVVSLADGAVVTYYPSGATQTARGDTSLATSAAGARFVTVRGKVTCAGRSLSSTTTDDATGATVTVREDGVVVAQLLDGRRVVQHADGTQQWHEASGAIVVQCWPVAAGSEFRSGLLAPRVLDDPSPLASPIRVVPADAAMQFACAGCGLLDLQMQRHAVWLQWLPTRQRVVIDTVRHLLHVDAAPAIRFVMDYLHGGVRGLDATVADKVLSLHATPYGRTRIRTAAEDVPPPLDADVLRPRQTIERFTGDGVRVEVLPPAALLALTDAAGVLTHPMYRATGAPPAPSTWTGPQPPMTLRSSLVASASRSRQAALLESRLTALGKQPAPSGRLQEPNLLVLLPNGEGMLELLRPQDAAALAGQISADCDAAFSAVVAPQGDADIFICAAQRPTVSEEMAAVALLPAAMTSRGVADGGRASEPCPEASLSVQGFVREVYRPSAGISRSVGPASSSPPARRQMRTARLLALPAAALDDPLPTAATERRLLGAVAAALPQHLPVEVVALDAARAVGPAPPMPPGDVRTGPQSNRPATRYPDPLAERRERVRHLVTAGATGSPAFFDPSFETGAAAIADAQQGHAAGEWRQVLATPSTRGGVLRAGFAHFAAAAAKLGEERSTARSPNPTAKVLGQAAAAPPAPTTNAATDEAAAVGLGGSLPPPVGAGTSAVRAARANGPPPVSASLYRTAPLDAPRPGVAPARVVLTPGSVDFGEVLQGRRYSVAVNVTNVGATATRFQMELPRDAALASGSLQASAGGKYTGPAQMWLSIDAPRVRLAPGMSTTAHVEVSGAQAEGTAIVPLVVKYDAGPGYPPAVLETTVRVITRASATAAPAGGFGVLRGRTDLRPAGMLTTNPRARPLGPSKLPFIPGQTHHAGATPDTVSEVPHLEDAAWGSDQDATQ